VSLAQALERPRHLPSRQQAEPNLDGELFSHIDEMKSVVERWRMAYNPCRSHSRLSHVTPTGSAQLCREIGCIKPHTPVPDGVQDCGILS
jgi:transposase InsO family protein